MTDDELSDLAFMGTDAEWFEQSGGCCGGCGCKGDDCTCDESEPCGCRDLHPMGSHWMTSDERRRAGIIDPVLGQLALEVAP